MKTHFKENIIDSLLNYRTLILIFCIILSIFAINYNFNSNNEVVISSISNQKELFKLGLHVDSDRLQQSLPQLNAINGNTITNLEQAYELLNNLKQEQTHSITIDSKIYSFYLPNTTQSTIDFLGMSLQEAYSSNIKLGIDLSGGSRIILQANDNLTPEEFEELRTIVENRLNVFGASGSSVKIISDQFSSEQFLLIESPNSNKNSIFELIERQGNFEAKLGNVTVFTGVDVKNIIDDAQHSQVNCNSNSPYQCSISFTVQITPQAAEKMLQEASQLPVVGGHLSEELSFHLDGEEKESLRVASTFKYQKVLAPQITLSGITQDTLDLAQKSAQHEKKILETILLTKPLPSELTVVQSFSQSPQLSQEFLQNALIVGLLAVLIVSTIIALRYQNPIIFVLIAGALVSELILIFGASVLFRISIDLAAIGGLIAAIGTGVDDQIIITDEYHSKKKKQRLSAKRIKHAMTIILIAYLTTIAAIGPLFFAGLSLLKGFAFMIILGVSIGVFITRPVYATTLRYMLTTRAQRVEEAEEIRKEEEESNK